MSEQPVQTLERAPEAPAGPRPGLDVAELVARADDVLELLREGEVDPLDAIACVVWGREALAQ